MPFPRVVSIARRLLPKRAWTALRLMRQRYAISRFRSYTTTKDYGGHRLTIRIADPLARGWYDCDWKEPPEFALLRQHGLRPGALVFDLGAHQCIVGLMLARSVGSQGRVIAVEANAHNATIGKLNVQLNGAPNLTILHAAVTERTGTVIMNRGLNARVDDGAGRWGRLSTKAVTIDQLLETYGEPSVVYLDIEGYEAHALRGAERTLSTSADWFVEVHVPFLPQFHVTVGDVLGHFPPERYERFYADVDALAFQPLSPTTPFPRERFFFIALHRS